ncbi:MAG: hypothetical protein MUO68_13590 [Desulfobacteraceae bacterium]|nr:hypothetical protein [Desulfobacteraceae bacterium]
MSLSANGGTIRTAITTTQTVKDSGTIELEFKIRNSGNAAAHNVLATLILADLVKSYRDLGNNLPGGEMTLKERLVNPGLNPGKYVAVLRVDFEEQNARPHRAYHFFNIPYRLNKISSLNFPLSLELDTPCFNRKAFWDKKSKIKLSMKNNGKETLRPNIWLFLPDGFTSPEPNRSCRLTPGETKFEEIPLRLEPDGKNLSPYHLIVWYDKDNAHYSQHIKGIIKVKEQPAYFKGYLILGAILLVILFAALFIRRTQPPTPNF